MFSSTRDENTIRSGGENENIEIKTFSIRLWPDSKRTVGKKVNSWQFFISAIYFHYTLRWFIPGKLPKLERQAKKTDNNTAAKPYLVTWECWIRGSIMHLVAYRQADSALLLTCNSTNYLLWFQKVLIYLPHNFAQFSFYDLKRRSG